MILMGGNQRELPSDSTVASDLQLPRKKDSIQNDPGCCCCTQFCVLQLLLYILSTSMMIIIVGASLSEQHTDLHTAGFVTRTHK